MDACRFCLESKSEDDELFYPCRCQAPVHRRCLNSWRTAGMNPANLTRCEVCQYHYRFQNGSRPIAIHFLFYAIAIVQIVLFFAIALGLGQLVRATNVVEVVDWGRLSFMKPDTDRGWFFLGICFNSFIIGTAATIYLLYLCLSGKLRRQAAETRQRRSITSEWWDTARNSRRRSRDCLRDCCYSQEESLFLYCYCVPDCYCYCCEACCGSFDAQCTECCSCVTDCDGGCCTDMPTSDCGGDCGGENPCIIVALLFAMVVAIILLFVGMFVMFWTILINLLYGVWLNQNFLREVVANRYEVLEYNRQYDTSPAQEPEPTPPDGGNDRNLVAPEQEAMSTKPEKIGKSEPAGEVVAPPLPTFPSFPEPQAGTLVSVDLTGETPKTHHAKMSVNAL
mmetsp:Transcript_33545/g.41285  ORF Transcript_33545/g.41285 Transcript_33545/m.41285 type:complete len:394 (-) Transcript_33545:237-1418(-)